MNCLGRRTSKELSEARGLVYQQQHSSNVESDGGEAMGALIARPHIKLSRYQPGIFRKTLVALSS